MLVDRSHDPMTRLLVNITRHADVSGAALARAHRDVGRALAPFVAEVLQLEESEIRHVKGRSAGVRIRPGCEPVIVGLLRAGLFLAEGLWECFPGSGLVLHHGHGAMPRASGAEEGPVVVADAVINTGRSICDVLVPYVAATVPTVVVALVAYRPTIEALAAEFPDVLFIVARISDRSYVGRGATDTGERLFGARARDA